MSRHAGRVGAQTARYISGEYPRTTTVCARLPQFTDTNNINIVSMVSDLASENLLDRQYNFKFNYITKI